MGEHSVLDWVSMCARNLSERVLFWERDELITPLNLDIKIDNNVNKVKLFTKTWTKMVQKGVFFTVCHSRKDIIFQLWDH